MTPMLLAGYSDDQLMAAYGATLDDNWHRVIEGELGRREDGQRAAASAAAVPARVPQHDVPQRPASMRQDCRQAERAEWHDAAYAQYLAAEAECRGNLLNRRGVAAGVDPWSLWSGPAHRADLYASEELRAFWDRQRRITVTEYQRQAAAGRAEERETHRYDKAMGQDATAPVRPQATRGADRDGTVNRDRASGEQNRGPDGHHGSARAPRGNRPGGAMTAAEQVARLNAMAERIRAGGAARATVSAPPAPGGASPVATAERPAGPGVAAPRAGTVAIRESGTVRQLPDIDGAELLGQVAAYLARFARLPSQAALDAVVLWAAHCHARDGEGTLIWPATPRLMALSRERGSGKTTLLELLARLVPVCHGLDVEPTAAGVTYSIGREKAVIALDEGDILFGSGRRKSDLRAIINAGYTRHGTVLRMRGNKAERVPVYGPLMLAGLEVLEQATGGALDTLLSRSIIIRMAAPAEGDDPADTADPAQRCDETGETGRRLLAVWSLVNRDKLVAAQPEMPAGVRLRAAQIWRPLLAVAQVAGGDWPDRAAAACTELTQAREMTAADQADTLMAEFAAMTSGWDEAL